MICLQALDLLGGGERGEREEDRTRGAAYFCVVVVVSLSSPLLFVSPSFLRNMSQYYRLEILSLMALLSAMTYRGKYE